MQHKQRTSRRKYIHCLSIILMAIVMAFLIVMMKAYFDGNFNSVESFQAYISKFGCFGPAFLTVFQAVQVVLPVLPGFLGCAAGSVMFGPFVGFLCNYIGISVGSIIAFLLAKRFGTPLIRDIFPSDKYQKWAAWADTSKSYTAFLFFIMVMPLFPDDYFCYLSGVTEIKTEKFIRIIVLGKPWCILAYSLGFSLIK